MKKKWLQSCIALGATAFIAGITGQAHATTIYADADAMVQKSLPNANNGSAQTTITGTDTGIAIDRTFLRFTLPTLAAGETFVSATLYGFYYFDTWDSKDREQSWYRVGDDSWGEMTITWNNQPGYDSSALATWTPVSPNPDAGGQIYNEWLSWNILSAMTSETDSELSLVLKQTDETLNCGFEQFRTKEYHTTNIPEGSRGFYIDYTTQQGGGTNPVPEPATMLLLGSGIAGLIGTRLRRKK